MALSILVIIFLGLLASGIPIFIAIGVASLMAIFFAGDIPSIIAVTRLFGGLDKFAVMALPFYILAANLMDVGGLSERIVAWAKSLVRGITGGIAMATEVACMAFGALSGSSPATVIAIGRLMVPHLMEEGYDKGFIAGLITSSGSVASIIPPSITMMLFAAATGASTGALFIGGVFPGLIYGLATSIYCYWYAKKNKIGASISKPNKDISEGFVLATRKASWALGVPIIIIGGIYAGIVTPTEAAGLSAIYAYLVGAFIYKKIGLKELFKICERSIVTISQVMILIAVASIFAWLLTVMQLPQKMASFVSASTSKVIFLLSINVILLIAGMFMDPNSLTIILGPIFYLAGTALGLSPTHIGIILTVNLSIGMFTPPFGLNLFVAGAVTGETMANIYRSVIPFIVISIVALLIITFIPEITLFLPNLVFKGRI